jgi:V8-like Glu-specific endopeptidase
MRKQLFNVLLILAIVSLIFSAAPYFNVQADENEPGSRNFLPYITGGIDASTTSSKSATEEETAASLEMWTRDAIQQAAPAVVPGFRMDEIKAEAPSAEEVFAEPAGFAPAVLPDPAAEKEAMQDFADERAAAEEYRVLMDADLFQPESPTAPDSSGIYTTYAGNRYSQMWKNFPYMAVGRLVYRTPSGASSYCTASVISSKNLIVTAAHCLYDTDVNRWNSNWVFIPAEYNGTAPYGRFAYSRATVLNNWINASSYSAGIRYDVGLLSLQNNTSGRAVTYYTGALGRAWNYPYIQSLTEIGYPANRFGTCGYVTPWHSYVSHSESYSLSTTTYPDRLYYGSNLGCGASGSPLIRIFSPYQFGSTNYVIAVQSGSSNAQTPVYNVAPRFSSNNLIPLCNTYSGC